MPDWQFRYFNDVVRPMLNQKEKRELSPPPFFSGNNRFSPASFWLNPPEPALLLSRRRFDPTLFYQLPIFFWLPHFQTSKLFCPKCKNIVLEKNGPLAPRRIVDIQSCFYIVSWAYYCRKGCRTHYAGWGKDILNSLPPYLRLAFPAILSHRGGLSHAVITQLRVGNQHKMGPCGVRSLLIEMHTQRFNRIQLQYMEALFEVSRGHEEELDSGSNQNTLHSFLPSRKVPSFGDFSDTQGYAGHVSSERYLSEMLNKAIERDEHDANQHTACLAPDQIAIDDSHKVFSFFFQL